MNKEELIELLYQCFKDEGFIPGVAEKKAKEAAETFLPLAYNQQNLIIKAVLRDIGNALIKASKHIK